MKASLLLSFPALVYLVDDVFMIRLRSRCSSLLIKLPSLLLSRFAPTQQTQLDTTILYIPFKDVFARV